MKIGVNARLLTKPFTGIGQHTKNLFGELARLDSENEYTLVVPGEVDEDIFKSFPENVKIKVLKERKIGTAGMKKTWWEQISVPEFFEKEKVDIAFFPYPSNPWTKDWYKKGIKTFVTVHDCVPWTRKEYRKGFASKMYHSQTKKAVKLADIVFTVSEVSKKDIIDICGIDKNKIKVIYNDADIVYKEKISEDYKIKVLEKFNLKGKKFFLYVGGYDERKNVSYLLEEYAEYDGEAGLVLAGGKLFDKKLYNSYEKKIQGQNVVRTGFLKEKELAVLYQNCSSFVNFSRQEGFNIPILEAANCGAPLILSDIEVHKEIADDAAVFVDTDKKGGGVEALKKVFRHQKEFSKKAEKLAEKYSWKKSANKIIDVIN
ncbi:glycosyltransferase [Candidatus Peregrinibacteria bacterium]|nr:glycosyltransferase [Candidatus Peregrinibacteria bacterium]